MSSKAGESKAIRFVKNKLKNIKIDCMRNEDDEVPKEGEEESGDKRETWNGRFDFFLSALAYAGKFKFLNPELFFMNFLLKKCYIQSWPRSCVALPLPLLPKRWRCFSHTLLSLHGSCWNTARFPRARRGYAIF
jgi:hypothetical protein